MNLPCSHGRPSLFQRERIKATIHQQDARAQAACLAPGVPTLLRRTHAASVRACSLPRTRRWHPAPTHAHLVTQADRQMNFEVNYTTS